MTGTAGASTGRVCLGWQFATPHPDPGPPPRRPTPPEREQVNPAWVAAQRREENRLNRPLRSICAAAGCGALLLLVLALAGQLNAVVGALAIVVCLIGGGMSGWAVWQGERALRERVEAERQRVSVFRADAEARLFGEQEEHARRVKDWEARRFAFASQKQWYSVCLPTTIDRVDVAGGTLPGWSALVTTIGAYRLAAGGEVTVVDLTAGSVAADLIRLTKDTGGHPLVWVLPADLPRLDLGVTLTDDALASVLAGVVSVAEQREVTSDLSSDNAILDRIIGALDGEVTIARVVAGLRTLAQVGDPDADVAAGLLSERELGRITTIFGRSAERVVADRAWTLESQLRKLASAGSDVVRLPHSPLRVVALRSDVGVLSSKLLGTFVLTALTHLLGTAPRGQPWRHTLIVLGADRLRDDALDRLTEACETSRTGLVLGYRTIDEPVRHRLGRGNAALACMRLGNAEDAKAAAEQIGTEHRFVLSQLTETIGTSVTDTAGTAYNSTVGSTDSAGVSTSVNTSVSRGSGHGRSSAAEGPLAMPKSSSSRSTETSSARGTSLADSVSASISASTAWGLSTSQAAGDSQSLAASSQRSREFLVEQHELQRLPPSAVILSYASAAGRQVVLADVNPGISTLPSATLTPLAEALAAPPPTPPTPNHPPQPQSHPATPHPGPPEHGRPGQPQPSTPQHGQTHPGQPQPGTPEPGQSHHGQPQPGTHAADDPQSDAPASGQPRPGTPAQDPSQTADPPPNLGPPPSRLDWRTNT